jgi:hypothetical protein
VTPFCFVLGCPCVELRARAYCVIESTIIAFWRWSGLRVGGQTRIVAIVPEDPIILVGLVVIIVHHDIQARSWNWGWCHRCFGNCQYRGGIIELSQVHSGDPVCVKILTGLGPTVKQLGRFSGFSSRECECFKGLSCPWFPRRSVEEQVLGVAIGVTFLGDHFDQFA